MLSARFDAMEVSGCRRRIEPGLPLPPEGMDLGLDMIESQCAAICDPSKSFSQRLRPLSADRIMRSRFQQ